MFSSSEKGDNQEAVIIFQNGAPSREMLYTEFEAILDGYVPLPELVGQRVKSVYLIINPQLKITSCVFFYLDFDNEGFVARNWNVPLRQLEFSGSKGPDLGVGAIRLVCRSKCPIEWHQQNLWDPVLPPKGNSFAQLVDRVEYNNLGLTYYELETPEEGELPVLTAQPTQVTTEPSPETMAKLAETIRKELESGYDDRLKAELKAEELKRATLKSRYEDKLKALKHDHQDRVKHFTEQQDEFSLEVSGLQEKNAHLDEQLNKQVQKIAYLKEQFEKQLLAAEQTEDKQLEALREHYEAEFAARMESESSELKEMLHMREVELHYRNEQETSLRDQVAKLRREREDLLSYAGDHLLERVAKSGVSFVAFFSGAGHLTIPVADMGRYLDDPVAYAAEKCDVDIQTYQQWLEHHQLPICQGVLDNGDICGEPVEREDDPTDFINGESNRCEIHQHQYHRVQGVEPSGGEDHRSKPDE